MDTVIEIAADGVATAGNDAAPSAVSWPSIVAGAVVAAAASLIMLSLGAGLGLASISPWTGIGPSVTTFTVMSAIWLILTQWIASGLGGYLTGRLRIRWTRTHVHEVFFRDTAHGFLMWALSTLAIAALLGSTLTSAGGTAVRAAAPAGPNASAFAYDVDTLFRTPHSGSAPTSSDAKLEAARILAVGAVNGIVPSADRAYLTQLVGSQTGIVPAEAQQRVDTVIEREKSAQALLKQAADDTRKAGAALAMFTALSMLIGALIACVAAALGGQQRDEHI